MHAGNFARFVENCLNIFQSGTKSEDYHDEMNFQNYKKWLTGKLLPNLPPERSVVVIDNTPVQINIAPNSNSQKAMVN